jgi:hypothetical protein
MPDLNKREIEVLKATLVFFSEDVWLDDAQLIVEGDAKLIGDALYVKVLDGYDAKPGFWESRKEQYVCRPSGVELHQVFSRLNELEDNL